MCWDAREKNGAIKGDEEKKKKISKFLPLIFQGLAAFVTVSTDRQVCHRRLKTTSPLNPNPNCLSSNRNREQRRISNRFRRRSARSGRLFVSSFPLKRNQNSIKFIRNWSKSSIQYIYKFKKNIKIYFFPGKHFTTSRERGNKAIVDQLVKISLSFAKPKKKKTALSYSGWCVNATNASKAQSFSKIECKT